MISSGTTAKATTDDNAIDLIANSAGHGVTYVQVVNTGEVAGFILFGSVPSYLPAQSVLSLPLSAPYAGPIRAQRIEGGSNMTGLYASAA